MKNQTYSRREFLRAVSGAAAAGLVIAACAPVQPAPGGGQAAEGEAAQGEAPAQEGVELSMMMVDYTDETKELFADETLPAFAEAVPGATVSVNYTAWDRYNEEMTTAFASGVTPDVFQGGAVWAPQMAKRNWALPLSDYVESTGEEWDWEDFFPAVRDDVNIEGETMAVPYRVDIRPFWYRQDHLGEAGIEPPTNWEELEEAAIALTQREGDEIVREGFHFSGPGYPGGWQVDVQAYLNFMHQAGGKIMNEEFSQCLLSEPPAVEALEYIRRLIVEDKVQPYPGFETQGNLGPLELGLASTTVARYDVGRNARQYAPEQADAVVATLPLTHEVQATHVWINKYFVSNLSQAPDAAWQLIQYLTNQANLEEYSTTIANLPPRRSLLDADFMTENMKVSLQSVEYAVPFPKYWRILELFRPFATNLEECLRGSLPASEAMNQTCEAINDILAEDA